MNGALPDPIAITGIGTICGFGIGRAAFESAIVAGRTAWGPITEFDVSETRAKCAGRIIDFDPADFIAPARLRRIDRIGRLSITACRLALAESGLLPAPAAGAGDVGVTLGTYTAGLHTLINYLDQLRAMGPLGASALDFSNTVGNAAASLCALEFGLRGPNVTLSEKEASGLGAVAYAASLIRSGKARAIVTGGVDDYEALFFAVHDRFGVLAHDAGDGEASRPFDRRRNGFVLGNGAFLLTLEHLKTADERGAPVLGQLLGVGATSSACGVNDWPHDHAALARAMRLALETSGLHPRDVDVVFASANSTPALDRVEADALAEVFGPDGVPVVAVKGALGECGAASAGALASALLALGSGTLPPTTGVECRDSACRVDVAPIARSFGRRASRVALVNAFASGGASYCVAVRG
jgi:3-oxoacyl-[acyl-carrier-protein] synthase II